MNVLRNLSVPTGNILVLEGDNGKLECLSIGDYGKDVNLKADFMGLTRDIDRVEHGRVLPLEEKWVVTISTQYGCSMMCKFCDVPEVGPGRNATYNDLRAQVLAGLSLHPEVKWTNRLNIHFARMGEPTWNSEVIRFARNLRPELHPFVGDSLIHPVVSTMMPRRNQILWDFLTAWTEYKNVECEGDAGLQLSINSTSDAERLHMFSGNSLSLDGIALIGDKLPYPLGRKYTLNFAVAGYEVDGALLAQWFDPAKFLVKLTPMHKTVTACANGIETMGDYTTYHPYKEVEESVKRAGFDVLVFVASEYEDLGRITCGNAILAGTVPLCPYREVSL